MQHSATNYDEFLCNPQNFIKIFMKCTEKQNKNVEICNFQSIIDSKKEGYV